MSFPMSSLMTNYFIWLKSMQNSFNLLLYMDGFISNKKSISSTFFKGILFSIIVIIIILICYSLQLVRFISNKKSINSTFFKAILFSINVIIINLICYSLRKVLAVTLIRASSAAFLSTLSFYHRFCVQLV